MSKRNKICRLCLEVVFNNHETLNLCEAKMLKTISLDLNLAVSETPLICSRCLEILQLLFEFKTNCLNNEDYLRTYSHCSNIKLSLEELVDKNTVQSGQIQGEKENICRFCFRYFDSINFVKLDNIDEDVFLRDMLYKCLPEINLNITYQPLMCQNCNENVQNQFNFVISCFDNDEKIKYYIIANGADNNGQVDLNDVLKFMDNIKDDNKTMGIDSNYIVLENFSEKANSTSCAIVVHEDDLQEIGEEEYNTIIEGDSSSVATRLVAQDRKESDKDETALSEFRCPHCAYTTDVRRKLFHHTKKIHGVRYSYVFECPISNCNYVIGRKDTFDNHIKNHPSFVCVECSKWFKKETDLTDHVLQDHAHQSLPINEEIYQCVFCPYKTVHKNQLSRHKVKNHSSEAPYGCEQCPVRCFTKQSLLLHSYTHIHLKPHICPNCKRGFITMKGKESHILHKHPDDADLMKTLTRKVHCCTICSYRSLYTGEFNTHMETQHNIVVIL